MTRTSKDVYKLPSGELIALSQDQAPPSGAIIWNGYDYHAQQWIHDGQPDTRTLDELMPSATDGYTLRMDR